MKIVFLSLGAALVLLSAASVEAADPCANARAAVTLKDVTWAGGVLKASGTWQVGEGAAGVTMEYRVQSDRQWLEQRSGAAGAWEVALPYSRCGRNSFRAEAFPSVQSGAVQVQCLEKGGTDTRTFMVDCTPTATLASCQWECAEGPPVRCTGQCTGTGKGGIGNLVGFLGINGKDYQVAEGPPAGPWTAVVTCSPGDMVSFMVRDKGGAGAPSVVEHPCGQE